MSIREKIKEKLSRAIIDYNEHSPRRIYILIKQKDLKTAVTLLFKELGLRFITSSGQENPDGFEIIYHFSADASGEVISLRVNLEDRKNPKVDSITPIIIGAEWIEREIWELLGINFIGHPNLKRLLLAEEWPQGEFPLRHDHDHEHEHSHEDKKND
ncbi:MAG: NADH-quinone oxidoreductase subunit C [Candidatus Omnitrophota bacterium]|nr:NADH-quinone oxidoreductase subunit C [Candidatus Omnitrophota bacterium]MBU1929291.1 NADH-quinone oxidoreductase subunit C [Candidatus Omnitrophota bacterium]MBU2035583.1 NADH-quinone oxidoreductase subunit C [Candidatus Omnitrophota bacterium]MBU2222159.1 NADH-quinone oxidoreductase subunit C [Candidatus Omnitrophota bacterium]